jgi:hypothetical protein
MQLTKHWAGVLDDYVIDLAWSAAGDQLAAASAAGPILIFATGDGRRQHQLPGHDNGTNALAWLQSGARLPARATTQPGSIAEAGTALSAVLASGGQDGAVKLWDATAGQHTTTVSLGNAWVEHLSWRPPADATSGAGGAGSPLLFAAAGRSLVALRPDGTVAHTFKPAPKTISALALQPAGGAVAAAYFGGVVLWDTDDFVVQKELPYASGIHALTWSPDSKWLVSGNQDPSVHLWIPETDIELHMSGYETKVKHLSFDHTSRWLATSGGSDGCIWDCAGAGPEGREPAMLPHEAPVCALKFQNNHGLLATGSQDGVVQLWSPERRQPLRATVRMPGAATRLVWSPNDEHLAIGTERGNVFVLRCQA